MMVDFNLKLLKQGYYNICLNQVELYHYESKSRGDDTVDTKVLNIVDLFKNTITSKINGVICYIVIVFIILI